MNSEFFYDNVILAIFVGLVILAVALAINYFRKPTYKNQPDIVVHKADFLNPINQINTQLEKELTQARTELTTCQAERENFRGLWEQSVERTKALGKALGQERDDWKAVSEGLQKEYDSMKQERDECKNAVDSAFKIHDETKSQFRGEIQRLESELDRGNEIITWMKADLESLNTQKRKMEIACARLMQIAYYRDGARFRKLRENIEVMGWIGELFGIKVNDPIFRQVFVRNPIIDLSGLDSKLLNVTATPKVVDEAGEDLRKKPRSISSLGKAESICINDAEEKALIDDLMEKAGKRFRSLGRKTSEMEPKEYPIYYYLFNQGVLFSTFKIRNYSYLPASDFLPVEQPQKPEPQALLVNTGKLPVESITLDPKRVYPIHVNYEREKGPVGAAKISVEDGNMYANILTVNEAFLQAFVEKKMGLFIAARVGENGVNRLVDLAFCVNREEGLPAEQPTSEFSGKPFYTDAQLKEIEEVNNSTKPAGTVAPVRYIKMSVQTLIEQGVLTPDDNAEDVKEKIVQYAEQNGLETRKLGNIIGFNNGKLCSGWFFFHTENAPYQRLSHYA